MKENFPERAIICIRDMAALEMLVQYCEAIEVQWSEYNPMRDCLVFVGEYLEIHPSDTCICLEVEESDIYFGYCDAAYYNNSCYLNGEDERWNFCSVENFIEWTGGAVIEEEPDIEVDFTTIL